MNQSSVKKGLTVKDLVTVGIFSALFLVFALVGGIFFAPNPVLTFYMPVGSALLCGPVYLLMMAKVQKRWAATILGAVLCIIWFVTGMHWAMVLGYLIMGIIADLVAGAGQYQSKKINSLSYILLSLGGTGSYLVFSPTPMVGQRPCSVTARSSRISTPCAPRERCGSWSLCWWGRFWPQHSAPLSAAKC